MDWGGVSLFTETVLIISSWELNKSGHTTDWKTGSLLNLMWMPLIQTPAVFNVVSWRKLTKEVLVWEYGMCDVLGSLNLYFWMMSVISVNDLGENCIHSTPTCRAHGWLYIHTSVYLFMLFQHYIYTCLYMRWISLVYNYWVTQGSFHSPDTLCNLYLKLK